MSDIAVKLENISKFYKLYSTPKDRLKEALSLGGKKFHREFYALKDINLEIKKGEILGIVGRNGSGKSTLLKIVSGVIQRSSGKIEVNGKISALLELGSGLNPEFTGIQNIYFSGTMMGFSRKEMEEKIDDIIDFSEIGDFIHQPLKTYSSGMMARLGFALAINMDPEILILDEVLAVGDELFKRKCYAKMEEFFNSGCTILYVSHSINTINEICSRTILLDHGEQILEGAPKFVSMHYQKLLYADSWNLAKIRDEIVQLNKNEERKKEFMEKVESPEEKYKKVKTDSIKVESPGVQQEPLFLPKFKSKSTVEQKNYPVDIIDIELKTPEGKRVNALVMNEEYIFSYKVKFNTDAENVAFSMAVKNEKGLVISSARTGIGIKGYGRIIDYIPRGTHYLINCSFKCHLIPGNFYTNIGVKSFPNGKEPIILNRIIDASVFKVQEIPNMVHGGICHLDQEVEVIKLIF